MPEHKRIITTPLLLFVMGISSITNAKELESLFSEVKAILEHHCLSCHNQLEQKGDFSLQTLAALQDSGMLEPGDPDASHLLTVLITEEGEDRPSMPKSKEPLSQEQVQLITRWIKQGAVWPEGIALSPPVVDDFDWWSFQPIRVAQVPATNDPWVRNPIDAFVLRKLKEKGLTPSAEADRRTLIRRITYDLIGLPPTPEEVQSFVSDSDPLAYEKLVDRLLKSPHYGERWARHWLDVVKYADTCGYDKDKLRPNAWPYRDYVIRSFNQDKPYSQFIEEQVAGDVLFPGKPDGILGLGFIAAGPWDFIGHVEVPESKIDGKVARHLDRDEMVSNTINTFTSLTIQCARCHNHKFDPFTQQHYYGLQAIFSAVDRAERVYDLDPEIEQQKLDLDQQLAKLQQDQKTLEATIQTAGGEPLIALQKQIKELSSSLELKEKAPQFGYHSQISGKQTSEKWVEIDLGKRMPIASITLRPCHDDFGGIGAGFGFPVRYQVSVSNTPANSRDKQKQKQVADLTQQDQKNPHLVPFEIDVTGNQARFIRVTATKLRERKNDYIFALAELQVFDEQGNNIALNAKVTSLDSIEAPVRWARTNLTDGLWPESNNEDADKQLAQAQKEQTELLAKIITPERAEQKAALQKSIQETKKQLSSLPQGKVVYAATSNFKTEGNFKPTKGKPRPVHFLYRGNIQSSQDLALPGVLPLTKQAVPKLTLDPDHTEGDRRAALARWLSDKHNPLTWRSIVNRIWLHHFGQAIVASPNDFGRMGQLPTHPELLDWLALEFRDHGQSFKHLHKLIVLSSTYRQASNHHESNAEIDGSNQYLWRANRRRLDAEEIRDSILSVSGKLNRNMNGPGFYQFVLEKTTHSPHYEYHKFDPNDTASHRRSIYRFIVRSSPDPYMTTLDCADSSQSTPQRGETVTSLQALSLLNNRFNLAMAQNFSDRLEQEHTEPTEQIKAAIQLSTGRLPTESEQAEFQKYLDQHGLANLCRVLFNMSEFVYLD